MRRPSPALSNPLVLKRVFCGAINLEEHAENAWKRQTRQTVGGKLVRHVMARLILRRICPAFFRR